MVEILKEDQVRLENGMRAKGYYCHHASYFRGYVSRKKGCYLEPYTGRFGAGYVMRKPCYHSTNYSIIQYWIKEANNVYI